MQRAKMLQKQTENTTSYQSMLLTVMLVIINYFVFYVKLINFVIINLLRAMLVRISYSMFSV